MNARETVEAYLENTDKATFNELISKLDYAKSTIRQALQRLRRKQKVVKVKASDSSTIYYKIKDTGERIFEELRNLRREVLQLRTEVRS